MVFSSLNFLFLFFPLVLILSLVIPSIRGKNLVLLIASIFFYAWGEPVYVILMLFSITFNYVMGLEIGRLEGSRKRANFLFALIVNLFILGFFKYYGLCIETLNALLPLNLPVRELSLPIGISFYTFQTLSYIIDVYWGQVAVQTSPLKFGLYITMFPQLVAGPIVKYSDIEAQLTERTVTLTKCGQGVERIIIGLGKKVLLANNLGLLFDTIQAQPERTVLTAWLGIIAYTMQIYFDFSGYSDMAIGMGKIFGFTFLENFNYPYLSTSITEFWRRWHISLSSWFRDYVYIPLGGNRCSAWRHILNLLIVWFLTGLWHGASWNFVLWGLYYGVLLILEKYIWGKALTQLPGWVQHVYALILVAIGWVFFSITDFGDMAAYLGNLFGIGASGLVGSGTWYYLKSNLVLLLLSGLCCSPELLNWFRDKTRRSPWLAVIPMAVIFLVSVAYLVYSSYNPFLYFRF